MNGGRGCVPVVRRRRNPSAGSPWGLSTGDGGVRLAPKLGRTCLRHVAKQGLRCLRRASSHHEDCMSVRARTDAAFCHRWLGFPSHPACARHRSRAARLGHPRRSPHISHINQHVAVSRSAESRPGAAARRQAARVAPPEPPTRMTRWARRPRNDIRRAQRHPNGNTRAIGYDGSIRCTGSNATGGHGCAALARRRHHPDDFDFFSEKPLERDVLMTALPFMGRAVTLQDQCDTWTAGPTTVFCGSLPSTI